ncbi:unnamed protein product [Scytosiphon promiscuus]
MAHRGRGLVGPANAAIRSKKRSLACRAAERELLWPEHGSGGAEMEMEELARALRVTNPEESMLRLSEVLERSTSLFRKSPDFAIPEIRFSQIDDGRLPYYATRQINRRGVVVVRGVVPADTALRWRDSLLEYLEMNGVDNGPPGARDVFWSQAQAQCREHLGVRQVLDALNRLWKPDAKAPVDLTKSLSFCDRAFVGTPTCSSLKGRESVVMAGGTGGSQRWLSPHHSQAYRDIFEGRWEDWDPFKAGPRMRAAENAACSWGGDESPSSPESVQGGAQGEQAPPQPFRPFQGFISFGRWGEVGNLHVVPMMRVATAFMLLRPFMPDALEASAAGTDWLCGAGDGPELTLSPKWHQPIMDALVRLPPLSPGDAVFYHTDLVHCEAGAIGRDQKGRRHPPEDHDQAAGSPSARGRGGRGDDDAGIGQLYGDDFAGAHLSSLPICRANSGYVKAQREAFADGRRPPAFTPVAGGAGVDEGVAVEEAGFAGRPVREELTRGGKRAMGMERFKKEHYNAALNEHHDLLDIPYSW